MAINYNAEWEEQASKPSTPATGNWKIYFKSDGMYVEDDAGLEHGPFNAYTVGSAGERYIPASQMHPSTTSGAAALAQIETTTNKQNEKTLDFDPTSIEYAEFGIWMPDTWDAGTFTYKYRWQPGAGASAAEVVICALQCRAYTDDDAVDQAWGTAIEVSDTVLATGDEHQSSQSTAVTPSGTPAAGQMVLFRFYRKATDAGDTMNTADMLLKGIKIYFTNGV